MTTKETGQNRTCLQVLSNPRDTLRNRLAVKRRDMAKYNCKG